MLNFSNIFKCYPFVRYEKFSVPVSFVYDIGLRIQGKARFLRESLSYLSLNLIRNRNFFSLFWHDKRFNFFVSTQRHVEKAYLQLVIRKATSHGL